MQARSRLMASELLESLSKLEQALADLTAETASAEELLAAAQPRQGDQQLLSSLLEAAQARLCQLRQLHGVLADATLRAEHRT